MTTCPGFWNVVVEMTGQPYQSKFQFLTPANPLCLPKRDPRLHELAAWIAHSRAAHYYVLPYSTYHSVDRMQRMSRGATKRSFSNVRHILFFKISVKRWELPLPSADWCWGFLVSTELETYLFCEGVRSREGTERWFCLPIQKMIELSKRSLKSRNMQATWSSDDWKSC